MRMIFGVMAAAVVGGVMGVRAELPAAVDVGKMVAVETPWGKDVPGVLAADFLLEKPAGKAGGVVVKGEHFYVGEKRIRFWGVNVCFAGCFPTHAQADAVAERLARAGVNAVRFHHMDMFAYPSGIFADKKMETLSPEALDRLDYFVAALKKQGVYSNINLHVSRHFTKAAGMPGGDKTSDFDKLIDLFNPELIAAQKRYAKDLLGHVNAYTGKTYAEEPAVCMVEINNENTLFLWGGAQKLANLPEPYAGEFKELWNGWLVKKYGTREKVLAAWGGESKAGRNVIADGDLSGIGKEKSAWVMEQHEGAAMTVKAGKEGATFEVGTSTGTNWHLQVNQPGLRVTKGQFYAVTFEARAEPATSIGVGVGQAGRPWEGLGLGASVKLTGEMQTFRLGFVASKDEGNARLSFSVGAKKGAVTLGKVSMVTGGAVTLEAGEDPGKGTVATWGPGAPMADKRLRDWFDFLQQTDEAYWVGMRDFLKRELGVKAPITGTIGLGALGTLSQTKMDFVDAHAYWDHPSFPRKGWDAKDWLIGNKPLVDTGGRRNPLLSLAATRVRGKPFTVTEYNHGAPNEWQAECVPMIASFAALQDWDGVFLFAYSHNADFEKTKMGSFFDIEGNPAKWAYMPLASRIFVGQMQEVFPVGATLLMKREEAIEGGASYYHELDRQLLEKWKMLPATIMSRRFGIAFDGFRMADEKALMPSALEWTAGQAGTGQYRTERVFVGFVREGQNVKFEGVRLSGITTPFVSVMCVPGGADPKQKLLMMMGRSGNEGMGWDEKRRTVSDKWGKGPTRVEAVEGKLTVKEGSRVWVLDAAGKRGEELKGVKEGEEAVFELAGARGMGLGVAFEIVEK